MALTEYTTLTNALIQAPSSPVPLIATAQITDYINIARNQVAADGECVRERGNLPIVAGTRSYLFTSIVSDGVAGASLAIAIRSARIGATPIEIRPWEWFAQYYDGSADTGTPRIIAQQGNGVLGTISTYPTPIAGATMSFDAVWLPIALVDDTTVEAIPPLWTNAVPFYAAWLALQSVQRQADADLMFQRYLIVMRRARGEATPSELPENLPGGIGTQIAAAHQNIGQPPATAGRGGR